MDPSETFALESCQYQQTMGVRCNDRSDSQRKPELSKEGYREKLVTKVSSVVCEHALFLLAQYHDHDKVP